MTTDSHRPEPNPPAGSSFPFSRHEIELRVRYQETDGQGRLHHANFVNYFEVGRVEMLRAAGCSYRDLEASGVMLVVVELGVNYVAAARYDDLVTIRTAVVWARGVRIRHEYEILRGDELLATGHTVVAAVNPEGRVVRLPKWLRVGTAPQADPGANGNA